MSQPALVDVQADAPTRDDVWSVIGNERRRLAIRYLVQDADGETTLGELADHLAYVEGGLDPMFELRGKQRRSAYVALYQNHVPALEEAGLVETDRDTIRTTPLTEAAWSILDYADGTLIGRLA